jgi:hypothetical protein
MSVNEENKDINASFAVTAFTDSCNRKFNMDYAHKHEKKVYTTEKINAIRKNLETNLMEYKTLFEKALVEFKKIGDVGLWTKDKSGTKPNCPNICKHIKTLIDSISSIPANELDEKMAVQIKRQFGHVIGKLRRNFPAFCIGDDWYDMYVQKMNDMIKQPSKDDKTHYTSGLNIIFNSPTSKHSIFKDFDEYLYITRMFTVIPTIDRYNKHITYVNQRKTGLVQSSTKPMFTSEPSFKSERKNKSERKFGNKKMVNIPKANDPKSELSTEALLMQMKSMQLSM